LTSRRGKSTRHKFCQVFCIVLRDSEWTRALTFENLCKGEHRERMLAERRAIQEKEDAARKKVEDAEALKVLGNALLKTGNLQGALDKYCEAVAKDPGNYVAWANAAHVRLELGQVTEEVEACTKGISTKALAPE
jgi:cytochrome c-type biogenesis protein CcmH/NrfG